MDEPLVFEPRVLPERWTTTTVRGVCRACNSGWMSELESASIEILRPLIHNRCASLDPHAMKVLAAWTSKTSIMLEYLDPRFQSTTETQRRHLRLRGYPAKHTVVWMGRQRCEAAALAFRSVGSGVFSTRGPTRGSARRAARRAAGRPERCNTHWTMLGFGHVAFFVLTTTVPEFVPAFGRPKRGRRRLVRIWPPTDTESWPPRMVLSDLELLMISGALHERLREPNGLSRPLIKRYLKLRSNGHGGGLDPTNSQEILDALRRAGLSVDGSGRMGRWEGSRRSARRAVKRFS